jgi:hypothetical protein
MGIFAVFCTKTNKNEQKSAKTTKKAVFMGFYIILGVERVFFTTDYAIVA